MKIQVTQEHIDHGERSSCRKCPIALAIQPHVNPHFEVYVRVSTVAFGRIGTQRQPYVLAMPEPAREFVDLFDAELEVKPFEFELSDRTFDGKLAEFWL